MRDYSLAYHDAIAHILVDGHYESCKAAALAPKVKRTL